MNTRSICVLLAAVLATPAPGLPADEVRIKDVTDVAGAQGNHLTGVGLVVGLDKTGDRKVATQQLAVDMLKKFGMTFSTNEFKSENIAMVTVVAELSPFARRGGRLDVMVSAFHDAKSLQGGTLLMTPLRGADGEVYALAQGPVLIGGFDFSARAASATKNHPTNGRIANGGLVVREELGQIACNGSIRLLLRDPDYSTVKAMAQAISARFPGRATALDAGTVQVSIPKERGDDVTGFVGEIGLLSVETDVPARVVINERTGTVIVGEHVKIATVGITHGNIAVTTSEEPQVSQPAPLSKGETTVVPRTKLEVVEQGGAIHVLEQVVTVADLAKALNALGVTPRDLIAIFQALKQAGALHAELVLM